MVHRLLCAHCLSVTLDVYILPLKYIEIKIRETSEIISNFDRKANCGDLLARNSNILILQAILASSRVVTVSDFGVALLEISPVTGADAGEYTVVAVNPLGECRQSAILNIIGETYLDEN